VLIAATGAALGAALAGPLAGADPAPPAKTVDVQLLSFNDYHGHLEPPSGTDGTLGEALDPAGTIVGGAEYLATTLAQLRTPGRPSLTVAAGDLIGGSPFLSGLFHDEPSVESLEAMELDVSSVGNHEFDEGVTELVRMQEGGCHPEDGCAFPGAPYDGADFPWLAANVRHQSGDHEGQTVLPGTWVEKVGGVEVGFIGMTLEGTPELVAQAGIQGISFEDEVTTANAAVHELRERGVKAIVVLLHEGGVQSGTYDGCSGISGPIVQIAEQLDAEIDLLVTGHTHQPYVCSIDDPSGAPRMVTSAASFGRVVTETTLPVNRKSGQVDRARVTVVNHLVTRTVPKDAAQTAIIAKWTELAAPRANRVVGTITADIIRSETRDRESSLANLIADAQLAATADPQDGGAQIALMNPGGVRADLTTAQISGGEQPGEVTFGEAFTVQPFGNLLVTMDLTGQQLHDVLEQQALEERSRPVLIFGVSEGFTFSYAPSAPFGQRIDPASMLLNGTPIDPAGTYRVTVNSFLADGGDGFSVLTEGTNRLGGGDDLTAFVDHLTVSSPVAPAPVDRIVELPAATAPGGPPA
jgi:2',3'-cyclic-nucleotide 2'-phosphodiesterase (5'-nucleotidase family)